LPFANLTGDPGQQYFADGVTEDLTTDLSRIADSFVISRNTAFTYKDKPVDTKQIGRDLSVRYVLEGSVQRSGSQIRINTQLIDAEIDAHVWAERFERDIGDLFALQSEVTGRIANALNLELVIAETARSTPKPDALDYILRGRAAYNKPPTPAGRTEAIGLFEQALALDPHSVEAQSWLALGLVSRAVNGMSDTKAADIARGEELIAQVLAVSPGNPVAHFTKGLILMNIVPRRYAEAAIEFEAVIAADRNWANAYVNAARCKLLSGGSLEEVTAAVEHAVRLSPRDPALYYWYDLLGRVSGFQNRPADQIAWWEKSRSANPAIAAIHAELAAAYANKGDTERAAAELTEARRLDHDGQFLSIARVRAHLGDCALSPQFCAMVDTYYYGGLGKAGERGG
jgi:TolB-like protein/predicted Zn-dependent protease